MISFDIAVIPAMFVVLGYEGVSFHLCFKVKYQVKLYNTCLQFGWFCDSCILYLCTYHFVLFVFILLLKLLPFLTTQTCEEIVESRERRGEAVTFLSQ